MLARLVNGRGDLSDARLASLLDRAGRAHSSDPLTPWSRQDLEDPGPGSFGVEFDDGDGHLVGYVRCASSTSGHGDCAWDFELVTHPFWAGRVEYEMFAVLHAHLLLLGGGEVTWWSSEQRISPLARAIGFRPGVELCELTCPDHQLAPPGLLVRADVAPGRRALPGPESTPARGVRLVAVGEDQRPLGRCWAIPYDAGRRVEIRSIRCLPGAHPGVVAALASGALTCTQARAGCTAVASVDASDCVVLGHLLDAGFSPGRRHRAHRVLLPAPPEVEPAP